MFGRNILASNSGNQPRRPKLERLQGFTLIELLTCMGIISILMGLLLPALGLARARSMQSKCGSNQHQIALAITQFAGDNFDLLPREGIAPWVGLPRRGANVPWIVAIQPYAKPGRPADELRSPIYLDPAHPNPNHWVHYVVNGIAFEQSANGRLMRVGDRRPAEPGAQAQRPGQTIYLTSFTDDRDNSIALMVGVWNLQKAAGVYDVWNAYHLWGPDHGSNRAATNVRRVGLNRHGKTNNVLYFDMHVATLAKDDIQDGRNWFDSVPLRRP